MQQKFGICLEVQEGKAFGQAYGMRFSLWGRKKKLVMLRAVQTKQKTYSDYSHLSEAFQN